MLLHQNGKMLPLREEMLLTDALTQLPRLYSSQEISLEVQVDHTAFIETWLVQVYVETKSCPVLSIVYQLILNRWPTSHHHLPRTAHHYWDLSDELPTDNLLLLKISA